MFRATVLSVVLLFAAGPSASLFCQAWCVPEAAAATGCHGEHRGSATSVATDDSCRDSGQGHAILTKEDLRRGSTGGTGNVIALPPRFALAATSLRAVTNLGRALSDLKRPLTTPLRI